MKGLNTTERDVLETLATAAKGTACNDEWCTQGGGAFPEGQIKAVWDLVKRGLAISEKCDLCPGLEHISITPDGLLVLQLVKAAENTPVEKLP